MKEDGSLNVQLHIKKVFERHFRNYVLVAENAISVQTRSVNLLQSNDPQVTTPQDNNLIFFFFFRTKPTPFEHANHYGKDMELSESAKLFFEAFCKKCSRLADWFTHNVFSLWNYNSL